MRIPLGLVLAHARRNWFRSLLTLGSVFVALVVFGSLRTAVTSLEVTVQGVSSTRVITESAVSLFVTLPKKALEDIKALPGILTAPDESGNPRKLVTQFTWFGGTWVDETRFFARFGCDPLSLWACYDDDIDMVTAPGEKEADVWKRFAATKTGCVLGWDLKEKHGFEIGQKVQLIGSIYPGTYELEIVGFYRATNPSYDESTLYFQWEYMNEVSKANGGPAETIGVISTRVANPDRAGETAAAIDALFVNSANRTRTQTERAFQANFLSMWGGMPDFFAFLGRVALAASLLIILNTAILNAQERIRETGVLKTLGFTDGTVLALTLIESLLLCTAGGALAAPLIGSFHSKVVPGLNLPLYVPPGNWSVLLGIGAGLGLVAGIVPAWRASRLKIVEALRRRA
jgi:putative ABC transport system permease protein